MEALKDDLSELEFGSSAESFQKYLDSQRELFHSQIDQLRNIVVAQCKLTGANPLSQEMAAGALSIKIGKRPRDLLNPKAVMYMQFVFSIKEAISKKESRDISALFGVTVTQVKDFFNSQRSRVRKLVRLSREKAIRSNACKESLDRVLTSSDSMMPIAQVPLNSVGPASAEEEASCSTQDEALPGIDDSEKHFVENIFNLMRKEETFSGQMKLMEWILQIQNTSVLYWFLSKDGVMILASWLSEAAIEEQTSVLIVILKVLCHLPLHKALPAHMSAILQSVNRLRFYKASDISNRAKVLLTRWSKMFARSQAMKKLNGTKSSSGAQKEITLKQSIGELMGDESWQSSIDIPEDILASSYENSENIRKLESPQALKLLTASSDDPSRKNILGVSASQIRGRRKVQLVEQPGQKSSGRSSQVTRTQYVIQGRPMSADDIQKAKMRAQFMQSKYGKTAPFSNESHEEKPEGSNKSSIPQASILLPGSKVPVRPKTEEHKKPVILPSNISNRPEAHFDQKPKMDLKEVLLEECKRVQIPWLTPPEVKLNNVWRVGAGENSKEVEVQKNRNRRDKEPIYQTVQEIPFNPKEPWDLEMDYDDTLTPIIPIEQPPDADNAETPTPQVSANEVVNSAVAVAASPASSQVDNGSATEPDLELLAVLLKNPELVFALTSGQAGNLTGEDTVKLLDMIKAGGVGLTNNLNRLDRKEEKVEVSLPSPTPSTNPGTAGGRPEPTRNPLTQQRSTANRVAYAYPGVATTIPAVETVPAVPHGNIMLPTQPATAPALPRHYQPAIPSFSMPQTNTMGPEKQAPSMVPALHHTLPAHSPRPSEVVLTMKNSTISNLKPAPVTTALNASVPPFLPMPRSPQQSPSDFWRDRQGFTSNPRSQANQNNYNTSLGGPRQPPSLSGPPPWERNDYMDDDGFESWSPDNSPARAPEYMAGRNFPEPRMNMNSGRDFRADRSRQRDSPGYRDHNNRNNNRRWRDRRH